MTDKRDHIAEHAHIYEAALHFTEKDHGGVLKTPQAAIEFAEVILRNGNYDGNWQEQLPLTAEATEQGWLVRGSLNADMKQIGRGPWEISVRRRDAKIIGINHLHQYPPSPIKIRSSEAQGSDSSTINHIEG